MSRPPRAFRKRGPLRALARAQVAPERLDRLRAQRDDALLAPLPEHPHATLPEVDILQVQSGQLRDADPARVEDLQDGPIAPTRLVIAEPLAEEGIALIDREMGRQPPGEARRAHLAGRIRPRELPPDQEPEEAPQRGQAPGDGRPGQPALVEVGQVAADHAGIRVGQRPEAAPLEKGRTVDEVRPVAAHGVLGGGPLRHQVPKERRDGRAARLAAGRLHALSVSRR